MKEWEHMKTRNPKPQTEEINAEICVFPDERRKLLDLIKKFASKIQDPEERSDFLKNAGIEPSFLNGINLAKAPDTIALSLIVRMQDFPVSLKKVNYHPLLCFVRGLMDVPGMFNLGDEDHEFCRVLETRITENLRIIEARSAVCRVETSDGNPIGTGVYLGNRFVLTCGHVWEEARGMSVRVRFRYFKEKDLDLELCVVGTEPEPVSAGVRPNPDHALLRLQKEPLALPVRIAAMPMGSGPEAFVRMLHHPGGVPLRISEPGKIELRTEDHLLHTIDSAEKISSGAPLVNSGWELVGIHQGSAEDHEKDEQGRAGFKAVAIDRILKVPRVEAAKRGFTHCN